MLRNTQRSEASVCVGGGERMLVMPVQNTMGSSFEHSSLSQTCGALANESLQFAKNYLKHFSFKRYFILFFFISLYFILAQFDCHNLGCKFLTQLIKQSLLAIHWEKLDLSNPSLHPGFHGVMVSTQDSESCDPSSNLGGTYCFCLISKCLLQKEFLKCLETYHHFLLKILLTQHYFEKLV